MRCRLEKSIITCQCIHVDTTRWICQICQTWQNNVYCLLTTINVSLRSTGEHWKTKEHSISKLLGGTPIGTIARGRLTYWDNNLPGHGKEPVQILCSTHLPTIPHISLRYNVQFLLFAVYFHWAKQRIAH